MRDGVYQPRRDGGGSHPSPKGKSCPAQTAMLIGATQHLPCITSYACNDKGLSSSITNSVVRIRAWGSDVLRFTCLLLDVDKSHITDLCHSSLLTICPSTFIFGTEVTDIDSCHDDNLIEESCIRHHTSCLRKHGIASEKDVLLLLFRQPKPLSTHQRPSQIRHIQIQITPLLPLLASPRQRSPIPPACAHPTHFDVRHLSEPPPTSLYTHHADPREGLVETQQTPTQARNMDPILLQATQPTTLPRLVLNNNETSSLPSLPIRPQLLHHHGPS